MRNSSFGAFVLLLLVIAALVLLLTPNQRRTASQTPGPLWATNP